MTSPPEPTGDDGVEELAQPSRRTSVRRLRLDLALGAAVLLGIVLLTRHLGSDDPAPTPTASPAPTTSSSSTTGTPNSERPAVFPVPDRQAGNLATCPRGFDCPVSTIASAGVRRALESAFPGVRVVSARTVRAVVAGYGQTIWTVDVRARTGDQLISLRLQPLSPADTERHGTTLFGGHAITHWEGALSQMLVVIDVAAPADQPASLPAVERLAHDAQMLSPW